MNQKLYRIVDYFNLIPHVKRTESSFASLHSETSTFESKPPRIGQIKELKSWIYSILVFITLILGIIAKHLMDGTLETSQDVILIASIIAVVIFPSVAKNAFKLVENESDENEIKIPRILTILIFVFTSGMGYQTLFDAGINAVTTV